MKLLILKGLPASGKSTFALDKVAKGNGQWVRVNKDEIRAMVHAGVFSKSNEQITRKIETAIILESLDEGKNVIVDSTNLDEANEKRIRENVEKFIKLKWKEVDIEIKTFDTPLLECIERDKKREKPVGEKVIREMYDKYMKKPEPQKPQRNPQLLDVVICDLDGTLALIEGRRSPYDAANCASDSLNEGLSNILRLLEEQGKFITFLSGREEIYRSQTEAWLIKYGWGGRRLLMRPAGDKRNDAIVKQEIYDQNINGKNNVFAVFDDRLRVCRMWHSLGLPLYRLGDPDADF